ncbi:MAG: DeoR/GlpR transcriptional regulator [Sedimentisphaerales bacterium]|nr:DeoR/GlpR transcriptional regulator [Sedimentisphaerales bacterium]
MMKTIEKRREDILAEAYINGHVAVSELSGEFQVSEATIRRDLHGLASQGLLELTHGGAKVVRNSDYSFISKSMRNVEAKKIIGQLASELVSDGDQLFLDSGTTCFQMTAYLRAKRGLSVIANSIRTAQELQIPGVKVLIIGGQYRPERMDNIGPMAFNNLENLRGYKAFLGTDGISMEFGLTSVDIESAHILCLAAGHARESILLADSSKFDQPALHKITDFNAISTVVTEKIPPERWMDFFDGHQIKVICP